MIFPTRDLAYYQDSLQSRHSGDRTVTVTLSIAECAAILQAHDYGIRNATNDAVLHLDIIMSKVKEEIWP